MERGRRHLLHDHAGGAGVLLIFIDGVDRRTLAMISFVGLAFGLVNLVVWFGLRPQDWWMGVLHLPLAITAVFGLIESRLRGEAH